MVISFVGTEPCFAQRSLSSTFVERPDQPPKVFVLSLQNLETYFLKPARSYTWKSISLNNLATINSKVVQSELDLTKEQVAEFRKLEQRFLGYASERLKLALERIAEDDSIRGRKKLVPATKIANELQKTLSVQSDEEIKDLLVPTQYERLNELRHQINERRLGAAGYLLSPEVIRKLGISKEQVSEIKKLNEESDADIRESAWKLRRKMLKENLSSLPESERSKIRKAIGKEYDWK